MYSFHCRGVLRRARVALAAVDLDPAAGRPFLPYSGRTALTPMAVSLPLTPFSTVSSA